MKFKLSLLIFIITNLSFGQTINSNMNIYNIELNTIDNESITLEKFKGKYLLIVNVASECGYTPQYKELKVLQENYKNNLVELASLATNSGNKNPVQLLKLKVFAQLLMGSIFY